MKFMIWIFFALMPQAVLAECLAQVALKSGPNWISYKVEIAHTEEQRARGLMGREDIAYDGGMLFIYPEEGTRSFWMKDTPLPLDILFFGSDRKLVSVAQNTAPNDETPISGGEGISMVLELNAGQFQENNMDDSAELIIIDVSGNECPLDIVDAYDVTTQ